MLVGHETVWKDSEGEPLARTGVTVVLPRDLPCRSYFAAVHRHSGYGEVTGYHVIKETGYLDSPILLTNTAGVGQAHEAVIRWSREKWGEESTVDSPVVAETDDGRLNDQLERLLRRVPMGLGRNGAHSEVGSGEIFLAFSTAEIEGNHGELRATFLDEPLLTELYRATVQATEEAVVNALVAADTVCGLQGTAHRIPHSQLRELFVRNRNAVKEPQD